MEESYTGTGTQDCATGPNIFPASSSIFQHLPASSSIFQPSCSASPSIHHFFQGIEISMWHQDTWSFETLAALACSKLTKSFRLGWTWSLDPRDRKSEPDSSAKWFLLLHNAQLRIPCTVMTINDINRLCKQIIINGYTYYPGCLFCILLLCFVFLRWMTP